MTAYYVSPYGSDSNNGLGSDPTDPTNKPWLTPGKALHTGSTISNATANTVYFAPGIYPVSAAMAVPNTISSTANPLTVQGDPRNEQGFKDGSGVRLAPGVVWLSRRTAAEGIDGAIGSTGFLIDATSSGTNGLRFYDLVLETGQANTLINMSLAANADWIFERCRLLSQIPFQWAVGAPTANRNTVIRACVLVHAGGLMIGNSNAAATANADLNILFEGCLHFGPINGGLTLGSAAGNDAGGISWKGCTIFAPSNGGNILTTVASQISTVVPLDFEGCVLIANAAWSAGTSGQILDGGYNRLWTTGANTNVTAGTGTVRGAALTLAFPDELVWGLALPAQFPLGWGQAAVATQEFSAWSNTGQDFQDRTPRPWGAGPSIGYVEVADLRQDTGGAITSGGTNSLKLTGAGEVSLFIPVAAQPTTITVVTASSGYGGASYPQMILEANAAVGLAQQTATATDDTEQTLTIGPFTPSGAGVLELRMVSRSTSGASATYFDLVASS